MALMAVPPYAEPQLKVVDGKLHNYEITAYTSGIESTGKTLDHPAYGITSSGKHVKEGHTIACDTDILDYGTQVYIPYMGETYTCQDTGSAIKGNRIDIYMESVSEALSFGRRDLPVLILD